MDSTLVYHSQLTFTGIVYIPFTVILLYIAYRYHRLYRSTSNNFYTALHIAFGIFVLVSLSGALAGSVFSKSASGIRLMLIISSYLLSFGNAVLGYIFIKESSLKLSPWIGFLAILIPGFIISVITMYVTVNPFIEPSGGVNWGMPLYINFLRVMIYLLGITPLTILMYHKFIFTGNSQEKKHYLFLAILFSFFLLIVITDFIFEPLFKVKALYSEVAIFAGSFIAAIAYFTTYELIISKVESQFRMMIENMKELIVIIDQQGIVKYANPAIIQLLNYEHKKVEGNPITSFIHEDDQELIKFNLSQALKKDANGNIEFRYLDSEYTPVWVETTGHFIPVTQFAKTQNALLLACHDITERKENELKLLEATIKAEESDRLKTSFISNIYHEIRTPLNALLGLSDVISSEPVSDIERKEYKVLLDQNSDRLLKVIDDLIEIAELESGKQLTETRACNYKNEISIAVENLENEGKILNKRIKLATRFPETKQAETIITIPQRVQQVFKNLLSNAIKFTDNGVIEIGYLPESNIPDTITFFVKDTGIGIAPENQSLIFKPFRQIDQSHTRIYEGTGLGLSITRKLIELLGGEIWVESEIDKGSTFFVRLPIELKN